ncbi:MAG: SAM hydrolase/SAM-dependent halogenase family protein [Bacteroidia bacterium]
MNIITITSDYGAGSHYIGALKGAIYSKVPSAVIVDVSHQTDQYNVMQAAFVIGGVYKNFPIGTWHILAIDTSLFLHKQILVVEVDGHYFIGADNSIFSLLFKELPKKVYRITGLENRVNEIFPEKNIFPEVIAHFLKRGDLKGIAEPGQINRVFQNIDTFIENNILKGRVMMVDSYQNAITNISKAEFEEFIGQARFKILYWKKNFIDKISPNYYEGKEGTELAVFNENELLEICMHRAKGAQLLGLKPGSMIMVEKFDDDDQ